DALPIYLKAAAFVREQLDPRGLAVVPFDGVAGRARKCGALDDFAHADTVEQFEAGPWERFGDGRAWRRTPKECHAVSPEREEVRRARTRRAAADDNRIDGQFTTTHCPSVRGRCLTLQPLIPPLQLLPVTV